MQNGNTSQLIFPNLKTGTTNSPPAFLKTMPMHRTYGRVNNPDFFSNFQLFETLLKTQKPKHAWTTDSFGTTTSLALINLSFYFLVDGEFMPPAFATAPTLDSCGACAPLMKLILPLKASTTSPSGALRSSLRR